MKTIIEITKAELIDLFMNWNKGAQPATIQYESTPKINKEGKSLFSGLFKLGAVNCMIDFDFEKAVNRQLVREHKKADFKAKPIWNGKGKHLNRRIIEHVETGAKYLQYKHQKSLRSIHFDSALNFIPTALLKPFFYKSSKPTNQGTQKVILPRTLKIENIRRIKMLGKTYVVHG
jgi:hypothetical protein